jgi:hypothetical protein
MRNFRLLLFVLFGFGNFSVMAQTELVLKKGYTPKTIHRFKVGDQLRFKQLGSKDIYDGSIRILGDSSLLVNDQNVLYRNITFVYLPREGYFRKIILYGLAHSAIKLPIYLFIYGNINAVVYKLWSKDFFVKPLLVNGSIVTSGFAMEAVLNKYPYKKYSITQYRLVYLNFSPG